MSHTGVMKHGACPKVVSSCLHARLPTSTTITTTPQTQTTTTTTTASAGRRRPACPGVSSVSRRCCSHTAYNLNWAASTLAAVHRSQWPRPAGGSATSATSCPGNCRTPSVGGRQCRRSRSRDRARRCVCSTSGGS